MKAGQGVHEVEASLQSRHRQPCRRNEGWTTNHRVENLKPQERTVGIKVWAAVKSNLENQAHNYCIYIDSAITPSKSHATNPYSFIALDCFPTAILFGKVLSIADIT